jgi:branched-chain amino acid transport system ATP-binding protein
MLKIENLHVYYGGVHALKGISLEVPEGKVISLIGANGAGKSSTLRSICGLVTPQEGKVIYQGQDITGVEAHKRVGLGIAMVPEGRRVFTNLTVHENLLMGAYSLEDKSHLEEDFEKIYRLFPKMESRRTQKAITLSGGEQQMLAVSRALMSRPKLLLMDEPSLGLAPNLVEEMFDTIARIHREEGLTVMLVEQNARAALSLASYGYVLEIGSIVLEGDTEALSTDERVKKAYIGSV